MRQQSYPDQMVTAAWTGQDSCLTLMRELFDPQKDSCSVSQLVTGLKRSINRITSGHETAVWRWRYDLINLRETVVWRWRYDFINLRETVVWRWMYDLINLRETVVWRWRYDFINLRETVVWRWKYDLIDLRETVVWRWRYDFINLRETVVWRWRYDLIHIRETVVWRWRYDLINLRETGVWPRRDRCLTLTRQLTVLFWRVTLTLTIDGYSCCNHMLGLCCEVAPERVGNRTVNGVNRHTR